MNKKWKNFHFRPMHFEREKINFGVSSGKKKNRIFIESSCQQQHKTNEHRPQVFIEICREGNQIIFVPFFFFFRFEFIFNISNWQLFFSSHIFVGKRCAVKFRVHFGIRCNRHIIEEWDNEKQKRKFLRQKTKKKAKNKNDVRMVYVSIIVKLHHRIFSKCLNLSLLHCGFLFFFPFFLFIFIFRFYYFYVRKRQQLKFFSFCIFFLVLFRCSNTRIAMNTPKKH